MLISTDSLSLIMVASAILYVIARSTMKAVLRFIKALIMIELNKYMSEPYFEFVILRFVDMNRESLVRLCLNLNNSSFQNLNNF